MVNAYQWFKTIAAALNDNGPSGAFKRYALVDMVAAYNSALCLIAGYRPDLFTELEVIELVPGIFQDARCTCQNVLEVVAQTDGSGNVLKKLDISKATSTRTKRNWNKPSCMTANGEYRISYANILENMNGRWEVSPPVPVEGTYYAMVKCVQRPCAMTEAALLEGSAELDADCTHNVAAWHFVLARMLSGDRFSNGALERSKAEYAMFFQILGVVEKQEEKYEEFE